MNYGKHANKKKQEMLHSASKKATKKVGISLIKIFVFSCLLLMVVCIASGIGVAKAIIDAAPPLDLNDVMPEGYATIIVDQNGNEIQRLHIGDSNRIMVELDQVPKHMQDAIVAIEDKRFWQHNGIDVEGIFRAIFRNIQAQDLTASGASTLTQQIIKNNVLSSEKKFERKIQEQYLAIQLEKQKSKEDILELYLNTAPFGRGTLGVQAAANFYFNKDVSELSIAESACIAAITQRPTYYDPVSNPQNNQTRQRIILNEMLTQGYITQEEYEAAYNEDVYDHIKIVNEQIAEQSDYSYFVDEIIDHAIEDLKVKKGYTENQAKNLVFRGGLTIYSTQDLEMQRIMDEVFKDDSYFPPKSETYAVRLYYSVTVKYPDGDFENFYAEEEFSSHEALEAFKAQKLSEWVQEGDEYEEKAVEVVQPQAAMVITDFHTGHVKAIVGGRGEKIGQGLNRATQSTRQPGSTFKVLAAYLPAIEYKGYTLATVIDDVPFTAKVGNSTYKPNNWYKGYRGLTSVRIAIRDSMNICAVKALDDVGGELCYETLINLGFTTLGGRSQIGLATALGGITYGVTPLELNAAYSAIANGGVYVEPIFYTKILAHDGSVLINKEPITRTVMKDTTAYLLTSAMQSVVTSGTGTLAKFKNSTIPVAGKTGTTQKDVDLVFSGYTPYYSATIWMGYDINKSMNYSKSYHCIIWRVIMEQIHANLEYKDFEKPEGIVTASVCSKSGKKPIPGLCDKAEGTQIVTEYFAAGTVPTESCDVHKKVTMCSSSKLFATEYCPESTKYERIVIVRPEPTDPKKWDPKNPPNIADYHLELPASMEGEYCNVHGPGYQMPSPAPVPGGNNSGGNNPGNNPGNSGNKPNQPSNPGTPSQPSQPKPPSTPTQPSQPKPPSPPSQPNTPGYDDDDPFNWNP